MTPKKLLASIQPGDIFATQGKGLLPALVRFGQWLDDCESAPYSHIGGFSMVLSIHPFLADGTTVEARTKIGYYKITDYVGYNILVMRHRQMDFDRFIVGWREVANNIGQVYPVGRLLLHAADMIRGHVWRRLTGRLPDFFCTDASVSNDWPVCSELWAQFFAAAGLETGFPDGKDGRWKGVSPDDFYDAWRNRPDLWSLIAMGMLGGGKDGNRRFAQQIYSAPTIGFPAEVVRSSPCGASGTGVAA